jgi:hypothetical protein
MKRGLIAAACGLAVLATASTARVPVNIAEKVRATGQAMDPTIGQLYAPMFPKEAWSVVSTAGHRLRLRPPAEARRVHFGRGQG